MADLADKIIDKFGSSLDDIKLNSFKQASFLESIYNMKSIEDVKQSNQIGLLTEISVLLSSILDADKELTEDLARARQLQDIEPDTTPTVVQPSESTGPVSQESEATGIGSLLTAAMIAPFAFKFVKGFLGEITDGLIDLTPSGVLAALRLPDITKMFSSIGRAFLNLESIATSSVGIIIDDTKDLLGRGVDILKPIFSPIKSVFKAADDLILGPLGSVLKFFTGGVVAVTKLFGKLLWPFSIVMGVIDAVAAFKKNKEGTLLEKVGSGIGGFLGEIVGAPFDVLASAVGWILKKFGFDETSETVKNFSFEDTIKSIVESMFSVVQDMVDWVKTLFTDPATALDQLWTKTLSLLANGPKTLIDILYAPINFAINWVLDIFKWKEPGEKFKLQDEIIKAIRANKDFLAEMFNDAIDGIEAWFRDAFDFLPSIEDIKEAWKNLMPAWLGGDEDAAALRQMRRDLQDEIRGIEEQIGYAQQYGYEPPEGSELRLQELRRQLENLPQGRRGGIFNMPESGGLAMLHGQEAVIPLDSAEGRSVLAQKTSAIAQESTAMSTRPAPVIVQGGTNAPVTNNVNNSQNTVVNKTVDPIRRLNHMPM